MGWLAKDGSHRHPKDEPGAVARHAQHVQGRAGSERGSSLAGRTTVSKNLNNVVVVNTQTQAGVVAPTD